MTIALTTLVSRLQDDIEARNGIPSAEQYERAVTDAVADLSRRAGRLKITTLSIVAGTATYSLPADFVSLVRLESLTTPDRVIISSEGLIPVSATYKERWTIGEGSITFYHTPTYNLSRDLEYKAGWVLDASSEYAEMGEDEAEICLRLAAAKCLELQANKAAQEAWQYQIGDERVSKERLAEALRAQAKAQQAAYMAAVETYKGGARSIRSSYQGWEYS